MAAAYRAVDRLHGPLTSPLEDICASTAHLKVYWPSSFQKIQEVTLKNKDYSNTKPHGSQREPDDLIILNVYKTNDPSTSWGLGPSPLSPLYIFYPALHPADRSLPRLPIPLQPKPSIFTSYRRRPPAPIPIRPSMIQYFLDRKDFCTHDSTTVACVRFLEEFVEWRLISKPPPENLQPTTPLSPSTEPGVSFLERLNPRKQQPTICPPPPPPPSTSHSKGTHAAKIFTMPQIRAVDANLAKTLVNLFTSLSQEASMPLYTTAQEVEGCQGVTLFFSQGEGRKRSYWWISEDSSWRCVYDAADKTEWHKAWKVPKVGDRKETKEESRFGQGRPRKGGEGEGSSSKASEEKRGEEITCGTVKLYESNQLEPVASVELGTGQMWVVRSIVIETIDVAVAIMFAVINLERGIQDEHELGAENGKGGRFAGYSF